MTGYIELTMDEALTDPLIALVMRADGVDPEALRQEWTTLGASLRRARRPSPPQRPTSRAAPLGFPPGRDSDRDLIGDCVCARWARAKAQTHSSKAGSV